MQEKGIDAWEQIRLDQINFLHDKCIKLFELRYQVSVIIIPTIIGVWGFIGLIVTSKLFENNGLFFNFGITLGICMTFFLILVWRIRVHDLSDEEIDTGRQFVKIETELLYKPISKEKSNLIIEEAIAEEQASTLHYIGVVLRPFHNETDPEVREGYEKYYKRLKHIYKINNFYNKFYKQIGRSGLYDFDIACQIIVGILGFAGAIFIIISPYFTTPLSSNYYSLPFTLITTKIFISFLLWFMVSSILKMGKLISESQRDDREFSNYIDELYRISGRVTVK